MEISIQDSPQNVIRELSRNEFPALLKEIPDLPSKLFVRGILPDQKRKHLCVVGSRKTSQYGTDACKALIAGLKGTDVVIVSGLAIGIDGVAHQAAIDAGLTTVAVLGSGLDWDTIYPRTNFVLAKEILASGGTLISESPPNHHPYKFNFPERNRIMAGLSHAILIIEAGLLSGTLITARLAADYNRDVFCVPGSIFSKQSAGPHLLLSHGAMLVNESADILRGLGLDASSVQVKKSILENCTEVERKVYKALSEPMARADILQNVAGDTREISIAISLLEMKGFIVDSGGMLRQVG